MTQAVIESLCQSTYSIFYFLGLKEQLAATKNKIITLKAYNKTKTTQLGIYKVNNEDNNKEKTCKFIIVQGSSQALLGMSDIDSLNVLTINYNTIVM